MFIIIPKVSHTHTVQTAVRNNTNLHKSKTRVCSPKYYEFTHVKPGSRIVHCKEDKVSPYTHTHTHSPVYRHKQSHSHNLCLGLFVIKAFGITEATTSVRLPVLHIHRPE